jgi:predicted deacetylase
MRLAGFPHARRTDRGQALVSLHDVTPAHEARVFTAISHLRSLGVDALNLLVVPDFHHRASLDHAAAFCQRLRQVLGPRDEIQLHGFYHLADQARPDVQGKLAASLLTAGEGEFHALDHAEALRRLREGLDLLDRSLGVRPRGFVAPAWLQNPEVLRAVTDAGLDWCEDQVHVHDLARGRTLLAPALTWASRSWPRRLGSLVYAQIAGRILPHTWGLTGHHTIRLAVHPGDYRHPALIDSIGGTLRRWLVTHRPVNYEEALCTSAS